MDNTPVDDSIASRVVNQAILDAKEVYVLMSKGFRVSRNSRAQWYLRHLNNEVTPCTDYTYLSSTLEPLSVISCLTDGDIRHAGDHNRHDVELNTSNVRYRVTPSTLIHFLAHTHRLVFLIDLSPSTASVNRSNHKSNASEIISTLEQCLTALRNPFRVPNSRYIHRPRLYVTIIGRNPTYQTTSKVIYQGIVLSKSKLESIIDQVARYVWCCAHCWTQVLCSTGFQLQEGGGHHHIYPTTARHSSTGSMLMMPDESDVPVEDYNSGGRNGSVFEDEPNNDNTDAVNGYDDDGSVDENTTAALMRNTTTNLLRQGMLALNMLPENSVAGMVIITDGVLDFAEMDALDYLMSQVRMMQFSVSFMCVGLHGRNAFGDFGYVPNTDLMQFIATSTFGSFLESSALVTPSAERYDLNWYQKAFLLWSFQRGFEGFNLYEFPDYLPEYLKEPQLLNSELSDTIVHLSLRTLLSVRLREGFTIRRVEISSASQAQQEIDIELTMTWKYNLIVAYKIITKWPTAEDSPLRIIVCVDAEYTFLHDLIYPQQSEAWQAPNRLMVLRRFIKFYKGLKETEKLLMHLEKFPTNSAHAELPGPVRDGMPVFFIHPDKPLEPEISMDDLAQFSTFTNFWKPICCMDINIWQKWLHTHRIRFLTHYDRPLPSMLFFADSRGRFPVVQCRQAFSVVNQFLREYTDFVLVEDSIYVKFINIENGQPRSYFILRITARPPCIVLRLAFLGSIASLQRHEHLAEIRRRLYNLTVTQRGIERPACLNNNRCATILRKSIERILIQYRETPKDIWAPPQNMMMKGLTLFDRNTVSYASLIHALSQNLYHERWIYRATFPANYGGIENLYVSDESVNHLLTTLVKMRLAEGFRFAYCTAGIVNLTLEVSMRPWRRKVLPSVPGTENAVDDESSGQDLVACLIQYVIFPPKALPTSASEAASTSGNDHAQVQRLSSPSSARSSQHVSPRRHSKLNTQSFPGRRPSASVSVPENGAKHQSSPQKMLHYQNQHHHVYGENLVVLSECWVEPQHGYVVAVASPAASSTRPKKSAAADPPPPDVPEQSSSASTSTDYVESNIVVPCQPQAQYLHDLQFFRIPAAIHARDREAVSAVFTFDALRAACRRTNRLSFAAVTDGRHHQSFTRRIAQDGNSDGTPLSPALSRASTLKMAEMSSPHHRMVPPAIQHMASSDSVDISKRYALAHDVEFLFSLSHVLQRSSKYRLLFSSYKEPFDAANTAFMNTVNAATPLTAACMPPSSNFHETSSSTNSANTLLFQHLLNEVREAHDTQVELTHEHQICITNTLLKLERLQNVNGSDANAAAEMAFCSGGGDAFQNDSSCWACFIKAISSTEVIVTIIPSEWKQVWRIASLLHLPRGLGVRSRTSSRYMLNGAGDDNTSIDSGDVEFARKIGVDYSMDVGTDADEDNAVVDGEVLRGRRTTAARMRSAEAIGLNMRKHRSVSASSSTESSSATLADGSVAANNVGKTAEALSSAVRMQRSTAIAFPVYVFYVSANELSDRLVDGKSVERSHLDDEFDLTSQLNLRHEVERRKRAAATVPPPRSTPSAVATTSTAATASTSTAASAVAPQQVTAVEHNSDEREFVLLDICCSLEDSYAKSFVVGVFQGLQCSMQLDEQDVLVAVEGFCEESMLVTDVTEYMSHLCPHLKYGQERQLASLLEKPLKRVADRTKADSDVDYATALQLINDYHADKLKYRIMLHYNGLFMHHQSVAARDILLWHGSVQTRFRRIVESASFRAVPSSQHYLYYCPPSFHEQLMLEGGSNVQDYSRTKSASTGNRSDEEDSSNISDGGLSGADDSVVEFTQAGEEMSDAASSFNVASDTVDGGGVADDKNTTITTTATTTTATTTDELTSTSEVSTADQKKLRNNKILQQKNRAKLAARNRNKSEAAATRLSSVTNDTSNVESGPASIEDDEEGLPDLSVLQSDGDEDEDDERSAATASDTAHSRHNRHPNIPPLFVHLVVSVRIGRTLLLNVPISSNRPPTCMQQLLSHIDDEQHARMMQQDLFSMADLNITLDVFGLTLSSELSDASTAGFTNKLLPNSNGRGRLLASTNVFTNSDSRRSSVQQRATTVVSSDADNVTDNDINADGQWPTSNAAVDSSAAQFHERFSHLPTFQHNSLLRAVEGVKWLMRDEIAYSLLRYGPIVPRFALDHVVGHVNASLLSSPASDNNVGDGTRNLNGNSRRGCRHEQVPLNFVFGVDESFAYFMEHFKSIRFYGYKFEEQGDLFYLKHGDLGRFFGSPPDRLHIMATRTAPFVQQQLSPPPTAIQPQQNSATTATLMSLRPIYHLQSDPYHGAKAITYDSAATKGGENGPDGVVGGGRDSPPRRSAFFVTPQRSRRSRGNWRQAKRPSLVTAAAVSAALSTVAGNTKVSIANATKNRRGTIVAATNVGENNNSGRKKKRSDLTRTLEDAPLPIDNADIRAMLQLARDEQRQTRTRRATQQQQLAISEDVASQSTSKEAAADVGASTADRIGSATPTVNSVRTSASTAIAGDSVVTTAAEDDDDDDLLEFRELTAGEADALHAVDLGGKTSDVGGTDSGGDESCHLWRCTDKSDVEERPWSRKRGRASLSTTPYSQSSATTENEAVISGDETSNDELEEDGEDALINRTATGAEKSAVVGEKVMRKKKRLGAAYLQQKHHEASQYWISIKHESLPPFWLILRFEKQAAQVYFHMREPDAAEDASLEKSLRIFHDTVHIIKQSCKFVNQMLLLKDMHNTRLCSVLLVPESSDDVWRNKRASGSYNAAGGGGDTMSTAAYSVSTSTTFSMAPTSSHYSVLYQNQPWTSSARHNRRADQRSLPNTEETGSGQHLHLSQDDENADFTNDHDDGDEDDDDDEASKAQGYLEATMRFPLGAFECPLVWQKHFVVHSRLKTGPGRHGLARALQALKSVLAPFAVQKRSNLFVYQDSQAKAVFYFRLTELVGREGQFYERRLLKLRSRTNPAGTQQTASAANIADVGADTFDEMSRATSPDGRQQQPTTAAGRLRSIVSPSFNVGDQQKLERRNSHEDVGASVTPTGLLTSAASSLLQSSVTLSVFGATEVTTEISTELSSVLQNRLDEAVVDVLSVALARNPNLKLSDEDWKFVQHAPAEPDHTIRFNVPTNGCCTCKYTFKAFAYYLKQNLETILIAPKFASEGVIAGSSSAAAPPAAPAYLSSLSMSAASAAAQWRSACSDYATSSEDGQPLPTYFIFHCNPQESGKQGIAVIKLMLPCFDEFETVTRDMDNSEDLLKGSVAEEELYYDIQTVPADRMQEHLLKLRNILHNETSLKRVDRPQLTFSIWSRGEVDVEQLEARLCDAATFALHDFAFEAAFLSKKLVSIQPPAPAPVTTKIAPPPPPLAISPFYSLESVKFMRHAYESKCPAFDSWTLKIPSRRCGYLVATQLRAMLNNTAPLNLNACYFESLSSVRKTSQVDNANMENTPIFYLSAGTADLGNTDHHGGPAHTALLQSSYGPLDNDIYATTQPLTQTSRGVCAVNERERDASATQWQFSSVNVMKSMMNTAGSPPPPGADAVLISSTTLAKSTSFADFNVAPEFWRQAHDAKYFKWHKFIPSFDTASSSGTITNATTIITRQRLVLMFVIDRTLSVCLYNCNVEMRRQIDRIVHRIISWQSLREEVLQSLILQKAGLFHAIGSSSPNARHPGLATSLSSATMQSAAASSAPSLAAANRESNRSRTLKLLAGTGAIDPRSHTHLHASSNNSFSSLTGSGGSAVTIKDSMLSSEKDSGISIGGAALEYDEEWRRYDEKPLVVDVIAKHRAPPTALRPEQAQAIFASRTNAAIPNFRETLKDRSPPTPLRYFCGGATIGLGHSSSSGGSIAPSATLPVPLDIISTHCRQFLFIRHQSRLIGEQHWRLQKLFQFWLQRERRVPINEDLINLFKRSAEFFHFVATPLLFDVTARARVMEMFPDRHMKAFAAGGQRRDSLATSVDVAAAPSRRASRYVESAAAATTVTALPQQVKMPIATATAAGRNATNDSTKQATAAVSAATTSVAAVDGIQTVSTSPTNSKSISTFVAARAYAGEESWHIQLRRLLMAEYCQYLKNLGYTVIVVKPAAQTTTSSSSAYAKQHQRLLTQQSSKDDRRLPKTSSQPPTDNSSLATAVDRHDAVCMQRCLPGGMLFIELRYNEALLTLTCYGLKYWHFFVPDEASVQREIFQPEFMDEYDRLRKLSHLHSFSFDRHLLYISRYIMGSATFFRPNYHISAFLEDFANYYQKSPPYARYGLFGGQLLLDCKPYNVGGNQLFQYLLVHDARYGLKAFEMDPVSTSAATAESESAIAERRPFVSMVNSRLEFAIAAQSAYEAPGKLYECTCVFYTTSPPSLELKQPAVLSIPHLPLAETGSGASSSTNGSGNSVGSSSLVLSYYLILTTRASQFPVTSIEEKLGSLRNIPPPKRVKVLRKLSVSNSTGRQQNSSDSPSRTRQPSGQSGASAGSNTRPTSSGGRLNTVLTTGSSSSMAPLGMQPLPPIPTSSLTPKSTEKKPSTDVAVEITKKSEVIDELNDKKPAAETSSTAEAASAKVAVDERKEVETTTAMQKDEVVAQQTATPLNKKLTPADRNSDERRRSKPGAETDSDAPPVKSSLLDPDREFTYQGYFSHSETQLQQIIQLEVKAAEDFLQKLVEQASRDCFRDYLWNSLVERMQQKPATNTIQASGSRLLPGTTAGGSGAKASTVSSISTSTTTTTGSNPSMVASGIKAATSTLLTIEMMKPPPSAVASGSSSKPSVVSLSSLFGRALPESVAASERLTMSARTQHHPNYLRNLVDKLTLYAASLNLALPPYEHFMWLIEHVWTRPVIDLDDQLKQLATLGVDIYFRAMLTLAGAMPHRFVYFSSPDRCQHNMLLLSEIYTDVALLVRVTISAKTASGGIITTTSAKSVNVDDTNVMLIFREQQPRTTSASAASVPAATVFQATSTGAGGTIVNKPFPGVRRNILSPANTLEQQRKLAKTVDELVKTFVNVCMFELWKTLSSGNHH